MAEETSPFTADSFYNYLSTEKRLMGVRCRACGKLSVEPRSMCLACHGGDMEWHEFSGKGSLSAFTSISIVPVYMSQRGFGRSNPYCTGVIALDEGPRVAARILGVDASNAQLIRVGTRMVMDLSELDSEKPAVAFRPEESSAEVAP